MKTVKYIVVFLSIMFLGIVLLEQVPGVMTPTAEAHEALMFNLFKISLLDDITHALSGILGFIALFLGYRVSVKYLMLIGGYYTLDAIFFILYGLISGQSLVDNFLLNAPHVGISVLCAYALLKSVKRIELV